MKINLMRLEVCSPCQNKCKNCAHQQLITYDPSFQLSIEELEKFIYFTKKSNYYIDRLLIHGPGEPLLWKHFNKGIKILHNSKITDKITIETNGLLLNNIDNENWEYIKVLVSAYPGQFQHKEIIEKHKIILKDKSKFKSMPLSISNKSVIPSDCCCSGPMFYKDKIIYCGPPVFGALELYNKKLIDYPELYSELKVNYMDGYNKDKVRNCELCKGCWANRNIKLSMVPHCLQTPIY